MGGIDNSAEELKRTSDVLADAIADVYWSSHDAEKAAAPEKSAAGTQESGDQAD
ncbi:hypothetical protein D3C81_1934750 [compost metagenome]